MSVISERAVRPTFSNSSFSSARESGRLPSRSSRQYKRYAHSDVGEPFIPHFSAIAAEGLAKASPSADEFGENTTVLTGATSDISYSGDDKKIFDAPSSRVVVRRCSRLFWLVTAFLVSITAVLSAPAMALLPQIVSLLGQPWPSIECQVDCQGKLVLLGVKTILLIVAIWALFWRRAVADFPRLYFPRAALTVGVLFILFAFWLFYIVRIFLEAYHNYTYIVDFSLSLLDALLYTHYISLIVLFVRQLRPEYVVTIRRDPDGFCGSVTIGMMSIQEAAISVLRHYECHFPTYNLYLDRSRQSSLKNKTTGLSIGGFKMYDIEGVGAGDGISQANSRALLAAMARRRLGGYQELIQEEMEWERRLKKRKYRLTAATEDAFSHVQSIQGTANAGKMLGDPMDSTTAAHHVFTMIVRPLNKFLRLTRQQPRYPAELVMSYIEKCLAMRLNYRTFLSYFYSEQVPPQEIVSEEKWSIVSDQLASDAVRNSLVFILRSHDRGDSAGVQLVCTVSSLPFFNLTEQSRLLIASKFAIKLNSESPV